jgi:hypothetical protein
MNAVMPPLLKQAGTMRAVLFVRLAEHRYEVGPAGSTAIFEPRLNGRLSAAWLHRLAAARGCWMDCAAMLDGEKVRPGACARQALRRAADAVDAVSPTLAAVLRTAEVSEQPNGRVLARIPARAGGLQIETGKPVALPCLE